jgi:isopropylmalate/homocitrate/citramalate synthase
MKEKIILFDVTMRDGLQDLHVIYNFDQKKELLDSIIKESISDYEIGSYASIQRLPQMKYSNELYKYAIEKYKNKNFYILIFNKYGLQEGLCNNIQNFSFITSYCETFLQKNINRSEIESLDFIQKSIQLIPKIVLQKYIFLLFVVLLLLSSHLKN